MIVPGETRGERANSDWSRQPATPLNFDWVAAAAQSQFVRRAKGGHHRDSGGDTMKRPCLARRFARDDRRLGIVGAGNRRDPVSRSGFTGWSQWESGNVSL